MFKQKQNLFRKESLERLSSPERLDQLMQVVGPKSWLPLFGLGSLLIIALFWSIYGRIPITVEGKGVLIYPRKVVPLQSAGQGQLSALNIKVGDTVKKGQVLATIDQGELRKQLQLARNKLSQLSLLDRDANSLFLRRNTLDKKTIQEKRQTLQQSLHAVKSTTPILKEKGLESIRRDRINLEKRLKVTKELQPTLKQRWDSRQRLFKVGAVDGDVVFKAKQEYLDSQAKIDEAESQLKQLDVKEADAQRQYLQNLNQIKDFQSQLQDLDSKQASQAQQDLETSNNRKKEIEETKREIAKLEQQIGGHSRIISQYSGRVLEIAVAPGQVLQAGTRLASVETEKSSSKLMGVTFFPIADGKKVQQRMTMQITPQTVKRERFGGILGTITDVSSFPITKEAAANEVGNPDVVQGLVSQKQEGLMQVFSSLETDAATFSGYKWSSSSGPHLKISPGTTTTVRVKVEERAPITFILPILRSISGIY
jgi:HlyD family secretion protein